ncbi:MAG TPA: thiamine pyrophosphate-dependent enzyme [Candidatus Angelobacter sp.]|nr:thiamine pyrophosphate-dependent enzyme [Candidatus Angelobacter sp.]
MTAPHTLLALYHTMVMARAIERRLWVLDHSLPHHVGKSRQDREAILSGMGTTTFACTGLEAVQVAAAAALRPGRDWIVPCPTDLALCLAAGLSPLDVMLAVFGRANDPASGGRQTPDAFGSRAARVVMTSATAGRHVVQAAGIAYASRLSGNDEVTLVCTDERGIQSGDWHEGINFAGAHSLPLICLIEDRAPSDGPIAQHSHGSPVDRAEGYGLAGETIDGSDFDAALGAFSRAVGRARSQGGGTVIHALAVDLTSKAAGGGLRPPEELEALARQDPIDRMRRRLLEAGVLEGADDERIQRDCASVVASAVAEARAARSPDGPRALDNVFHA